jgi:hypothetical protein
MAETQPVPDAEACLAILREAEAAEERAHEQVRLAFAQWRADNIAMKEALAAPVRPAQGF